MDLALKLYRAYLFFFLLMRVILFATVAEWFGAALIYLLPFGKQSFFTRAPWDFA